MMNKLIRSLTFSLAAVLLLLTLNVSQGTLLQSLSAQDKTKAPQVDKEKEALYQRFVQGTAGDVTAQKTAYAAGKEYLEKYPKDTDTRVTEIKDWMARFDSAQRSVEVLVKVYKERDFAAAFPLGKQMLTADPDSIKVLTALGYAGMLASSGGNTEFNADATTYAKKAIQLIEAGNAPPDWKPLASSKDETLGWLNLSLGMMSARSMPDEAIGYLSKAAQYEGAPKKDPTLYYYLAFLRENQYQKLGAEYKAKYESSPDTPEAKAALEKINNTVDLIVDAYARVMAYMEADPQTQQRFQAQKDGWMNKLTTYYKFRHNNSDTGLKEFIAEVRMKPLPGQPAPSAPPLTLP